MSLLLSLASLLVWPVLAFKGLGYRGLYIAGALIAGVFGFFVLSLPGPVGPGASAAELRGSEVIDAYASPVGGLLIVNAFSFLVAAALWRRREQRS